MRSQRTTTGVPRRVAKRALAQISHGGGNRLDQYNPDDDRPLNVKFAEDEDLEKEEGKRRWEERILSSSSISPFPSYSFFPYLSLYQFIFLKAAQTGRRWNMKTTAVFFLFFFFFPSLYRSIGSVPKQTAPVIYSGASDPCSDEDCRSFLIENEDARRSFLLGVLSVFAPDLEDEDSILFAFFDGHFDDIFPKFSSHYTFAMYKIPCPHGRYCMCFPCVHDFECNHDKECFNGWEKRGDFSDCMAFDRGNLSYLHSLEDMYLKSLKDNFGGGIFSIIMFPSFLLIILLVQSLVRRWWCLSLLLLPRR